METSNVLLEPVHQSDSGLVQLYVDTNQTQGSEIIFDELSEDTIAFDTMRIVQIRAEVIDIILKRDKIKLKQYLTEQGWSSLISWTDDQELPNASYSVQFDRIFDYNFINSLRTLKKSEKNDSYQVFDNQFDITVSRDYNRIDKFTGDTLYFVGGSAINLIFTPYENSYRLTSSICTGGGFY
jgi:hypothetical protein